MSERWFCPTCNGDCTLDTGGARHRICRTCNGSGRVDELPMTPATVFYHEHQKVGVCDHRWQEAPPDWDRSQDFVPVCEKCGMSFTAHIFMEMP